MGLFDIVAVDMLSAAFQTKQLGEAMLIYRLGEDGRLVAPGGQEIALHGLLHLLGDDGAEFMAAFTHGELESLDPDPRGRLLGRGVLWARRTW